MFRNCGAKIVFFGTIHANFTNFILLIFIFSCNSCDSCLIIINFVAEYY